MPTLTMTCRGHRAELRYEAEKRLFHARVTTLATPVAFTGRTVEELWEAFRAAVDAHDKRAA